MNNSVLSYANIVSDIKDAEIFTVVFSGFNCEFIVNEQYCFNPNCPCTDVILTFIELSEDKVPVSDWFMIRLDLPTWKVTEKQVYN